MKNIDSSIIAYEDVEFLKEPECRGIRLNLEFLKPEIMMRRHAIESTVVLFGSARLKSPEDAAKAVQVAEAALTLEPDKEENIQALAAAKTMLENSRYYTMAQEFANLVADYDKDVSDGHQFVVITGGGGGIMEAGNRGAAERNGCSIGLNITLPFEQEPNKYITEGLAFQFHYFSMRKMHFMKRAKAFACFPGGFGTMDELFEALTLVQTKIVKPMPILLFGSDFWKELINWDCFVKNGLISPADLQLFHYCDSAEDGWEYLKKYYSL